MVIGFFGLGCLAFFHVVGVNDMVFHAILSGLYFIIGLFMCLDANFYALMFMNNIERELSPYTRPLVNQIGLDMVKIAIFVGFIARMNWSREQSDTRVDRWYFFGFMGTCATTFISFLQCFWFVNSLFYIKNMKRDLVLVYKPVKNI